jgi:Arm DNA-binding domain
MHPERKKEGRPRRRGGFGYIVSKGTTTHPLFAIRWREGSTHKRKSGFKTRTEAAEALARIRVGLGDGISFFESQFQKRKAA